MPEKADLPYSRPLNELVHTKACGNHLVYSKSRNHAARLHNGISLALADKSAKALQLPCEPAHQSDTAMCDLQQYVYVNLRCQHFGQTCQSSQTHCFQGVGLRTCHQRIHCRGLCLPTWRRSPAVSRVPRAAGALQSVLASDVIAIRRKLRCTAVAGKIWFQRTKIQGFEGPTGLEG